MNIEPILILQEVDIGDCKVDGRVLQDYLTGEFLLPKEDSLVKEEPGIFRKVINSLTALSILFGAGAAYKFLTGDGSAWAAEKDYGIYADGEKPLHSKEVLVFMEKDEWYKIPTLSPSESLDLRKHLRFTKAVKYGSLDEAIYNIIKDGNITGEETKNLAPGVYSAWIKTEDKENAVRVNIAVIDSRDSLEKLAETFDLNAKDYMNLGQTLGDIEKKVANIQDLQAKIAELNKKLTSKAKYSEDLQSQIVSLEELLKSYNTLKDQIIFTNTANAVWVYGSEKVADKTHNGSDFGTNTMILNLSSSDLLKYLKELQKENPEKYGSNLSDLIGKKIDLGVEGHIKLVNYLKEKGKLREVIDGSYNINDGAYKGELIALTKTSADDNYDKDVVVASYLVFRDLNMDEEYNKAINEFKSKYPCQSGERVSTSLSILESKSPCDKRTFEDVAQNMELFAHDLYFIFGRNLGNKLMKGEKISICPNQINQGIKDRLAYVALVLYSSPREALDKTFPQYRGIEQELDSIRTIMKATDSVGINREVKGINTQL